MFHVSLLLFSLASLRCRRRFTSLSLLFILSRLPLISVTFKSCERLWKASACRLSNGRASQAIEDPDVELAARQLLTKEPLLQALFPIESHAELRSLLAAWFFAAATGSEGIYAQKDFLPSLRLCVTGSRVVIMMPVQSAWDWAMPGTDVNITEIAPLILALSAERRLLR